ncbi:2-octaprenyl-6-methoxyphenyl hydroxylase [Alkalilimnicola ehrlichii]|uniref:2-octaprenyl-6-methoxyphenyl hydroxylase n=1 Tax=Alkalilimnicola ehrlichii TaxID=351052 RepID=A0A3E0X454_9GAMM|nr:2-octaprenyl-6-methoxyphenyl hydroxylase [Alkalilimnicola ehrlichii]RFA31258.1 2-octaprenyl-6-methoxyphenyl hydroxylase [Alkalilimnicola ehrlichii]RFA39465.1 2-octaprenyl-6-methoxyphenyl hydroxylase [Alkalilimnicola ehrlichii]
MTDYDLLIVGGGLVGASLACALGNNSLRIGVVEAVAVGDPQQPSYDDRSTALAPTSRRIFEALELWDELQGHYTPIQEIHVSERGRFGFARLRAEEEGLPALGYVVSNRQLGEVLPERAAAASNVDYLCPAQVEAAAVTDTEATVDIRCDDGGIRTVSAKLLVVADGARSRTRALLGMEVAVRDYRQVAIVANLTPERSHNGRAFERFTRCGPMALLPAEGGRCGLIWSVPAAKAEQVLAMDDDAFRERVQRLFGYRLGRFLRVGTRLAYPLVHMSAERYTGQRTVVMGNAAHTLHPVAGQGFNLALRDVATLAELVHDAALKGDDPGRAGLLDSYDAMRRQDYRRVASLTDSLLHVFGNALPGVVGARNVGLLGFDLLPLIKPFFVRQASGYAFALPRLARGLTLRSEGEAK